MAQIILRRKRVRSDDVDDLLPLTQDADPKIRAEAVRALCPCHVKGHDQRIWDRIFAMVRDEDVNVRRQVFHALGDGSPRSLEPQVVASFEAFLDDADERLRKRARKLLAQYRRTGQVNIL